MLPLWSVTGILELPATTFGPLLANADCTVAAERVQAMSPVGAAIPLGAPIWQQFYDPADQVPYAYNFAALLAPGERLKTIEALVMAPSAAALGVFIDTTPGYAPTIAGDDATHVQLWFGVTPSYWDDSDFEGAGTQVSVAFRVRTDQSPSKRFDRTAVLVMRQQ